MPPFLSDIIEYYHSNKNSICFYVYLTFTRGERGKKGHLKS